MQPVASVVISRSLTLNSLSDRLPVYTRSYSPSKIWATDITLPFSLTSGALHAADLELAETSDSFTDKAAIDSLQQVAIEGTLVSISGPWQFIINNTTAMIEHMWLMVRYVLAS